ncbi:MAG: hypothetical protein Q8O38_01930 [Sulfurimicrobium sp.]|nr:hypothetical protein [Sulfurimicrobium sp.]
MAKNIWLASFIALATLAGCATTDMTVITDVKEIAAKRTEISKPSLDLTHVMVLRMNNDKGQRVEVTSIGPAVIGAQKNGAPAAKTTFAFTPKRDNLILFTQDVPKIKAYRKEIPVAELVPGKVFSFPVVQESGEVLEQTFTVERIIVP